MKTAEAPTPNIVNRICGWQHAWRLVWVAALAIPLLAGAEEPRKLRRGQSPEYPAIAKKLNIRGTARIQVTIAPDGSVKQVKELGGNPVLLEALGTAVKKWKYEAANRTSTIEVSYTFTPD